MTAEAWIGWVSSMILLLTIWAQIRKQWKEKSSRGVSWMLFIGQALASVGFVIYSLMIGDVVFIATNSFLLMSHFVGLYVTYKQKV